ncbi:MAG: hypothetical protein J3K34DRAFT_418982 [Monoraphidium minutum]|nr:MAG: hypothetical protein J3K34DRAFT_418982 [Monoraphidium minutum]
MGGSGTPPPSPPPPSALQRNARAPGGRPVWRRPPRAACAGARLVGSRAPFTRLHRRSSRACLPSIPLPRGLSAFACCCGHQRRGTRPHTPRHPHPQPAAAPFQHAQQCPDLTPPSPPSFTAAVGLSAAGARSGTGDRGAAPGGPWRRLCPCPAPPPPSPPRLCWCCAARRDAPPPVQSCT